MVLSLIAGCVTGAFHSPRLFPGVGIIAHSLGGLFRPVYGGRVLHVPRTQRSAISAFTPVFDALWPLRSGALQSRGRNERRCWYGPGSAERHEERRTASGTRERS